MPRAMNSLVVTFTRGELTGPSDLICSYAQGFKVECSSLVDVLPWVVVSGHV